MPLLLDTAQSGSALEFRTANCLNIGLINNMPDAAIEATERQFVELIRAAAGGAVVRLKLFAMPDIPRGADARATLAGRYRDIAELWDTRLDGLIVTGTEPRASSLKDEPYWPALSRVIDWAREGTASTIWSCLAAHAAVLHVDGIQRVPLPDKLFGIFDCEVVAKHPLMREVEPRLRVPHSRYNDLPERALSSCGYKVITRSIAAGVDLFAKEDKSLFLFFQGHPEYEAVTLLREYRRDIVRYLRGEREDYPAMPQGYFGKEAMAIANAFRDLALQDRCVELAGSFPMSAFAVRVEGSSRQSATNIYANWIAYLNARRPQRLRSSSGVGGTSRGGRAIGSVRQTADAS